MSGMRLNGNVEVRVHNLQATSVASLDELAEYGQRNYINVR
jgi:hypothetical protein